MIFKLNVNLNIRENKEIKALVSVANDIKFLTKNVLTSSTIGEDMEILLSEIKTLKASLTSLLSKSDATRSDRKALIELICELSNTALCSSKPAYIIHFQNDIITDAKK